MRHLPRQPLNQRGSHAHGGRRGDVVGADGLPLSVGLRALYLPTEGHAAVQNKPLLSTANLAPDPDVPGLDGNNAAPHSIDAGPHGLAWACSGGSPLYGDGRFWLPLTAGGVQPVTVAAIATCRVLPASGSAQSVVHVGNGAGTGLVFSLQLFNNGGTQQLRGVLQIPTATAVVLAIGDVSLVAQDQPIAMVFTSRGANDHQLMAANLVSGAMVSFGSTTSLVNSTSDSNTFGVGCAISNSVSQFFNGLIYGAWGWGRGLTEAEMVAWLTAPFSTLAPRHERRRARLIAPVVGSTRRRFFLTS